MRRPLLLLLCCAVAAVFGRGEKKQLAKDDERDPLIDRLPRTPVIRTKYGQVQGRIHSVESRSPLTDELDLRLSKVEIYQGIRYATPPVGNNRWQPTRAPSPWKGVLQATSPGPVCPQVFPDVSNETEALVRMPKARLRFLQFVWPHLQRQSEDCLYLNLFVPRQGSSSPSSSSLLPVMIYVHGESFSWGAGNLWDGRVLAAFANVIVVTFNYRLGILGFLNTNGSPLSRGQVANYGIMDQMAVLQWVQENVARFGGDPGRVTLMGHGTGAACIEYLAHSPTTVPGLFHRVILMSGSLFAPWARVRDPLSYALQLARSFNCTVPEDLSREHEAIQDCLREVPVERLLSAKLSVPSFHLDFGPSYDGVTIKDNFADIKGKRSFGSRTYEALIGVVTHDYFDALSEAEVSRGVTADQKNRMLQTFVRNEYTAHLQEILLTLQNEYTDWTQHEQLPDMIKDQVLSAFSDGLYGSPAIYSASSFFRKSENTYFYHFAHNTKSGPYATAHVGSTHGSELPYVFGIPLKNVWNHIGHGFTKAEMMLSKTAMTYWGNFAKSGDPNRPVHLEDPKSRFRGLHWEKYDEKRKYLEIGLRPRIAHHYRGHKMSIWLNLIPQLQKTGQNAIFPSHNSLTLEGPAWGVVRNASQIQMAAIDKDHGPVGSTCMTLAESQQVLYQHNDTLSRLEEASKYAYSYALGITAGLGGVLCVLNGLLIFCLCQKRRGERKFFNNVSSSSAVPTPVPNDSRSGSVEMFHNGPGMSSSSSSATPQRHQMVTEISVPLEPHRHPPPRSSSSLSSTPTQMRAATIKTRRRDQRNSGLLPPDSLAPSEVGPPYMEPPAPSGGESLPLEEMVLLAPAPPPAEFDGSNAAKAEEAALLAHRQQQQGAAAGHR